jgi:hypothetical protein
VVVIGRAGPPAVVLVVVFMPIPDVERVLENMKVTLCRVFVVVIVVNPAPSAA